MHLAKEVPVNGGGGHHTSVVNGHKSNGVHWSNGTDSPASTPAYTARGTRTEEENELIISIPKSTSQSDVLETLITSWIILVQRYQRDAFRAISWGLKDAANSELQCISAEQLQLQDLSTAEDLLQAVRKVTSKTIVSERGSDPILVFKDGTPDEWRFQTFAVQLRPTSIYATSQWRVPEMSLHQAVTQLHMLSDIVATVFQDRQYLLSHFNSPTQTELDELWSWNTPVPPTIDRCMHDIFSEQAQKHPDKPAADAWDGILTFGQVDQYSTELAQTLLLLDDKPSVVPVLIEKSRWAMVCVLAVMKSGNTFVLLDPVQPQGRLSAIIEQTKSRIIVASKAQASLAAQVAANATIVPVSESKFANVYSPFAEQQPKTSLPPVDPSVPMYVQFTSGSTGKPKGCMISHRQYVSGAIERPPGIGYKSTTRSLDFVSYAFDVSIDTMFFTLSQGGTLCITSDERRMNDLNGAMRDLRVNFVGLTPSVARTLEPDVLDQLDTLAVGGEGVASSDVNEWLKRCSRVVNAYGPSECTVGATYNNHPGKYPYITIGKASGCVCWLTDPGDHNKLVPIGAVGELLIEGPIVGMGYLDNPEKTNEVFIEDPGFLTAGSSHFPGRRGRMYKTGDLVRYDPDGNGEMVFIGRQDQQVKLRGQRIELTEIEYNMKKHLPADTQVAAEVIKPGGTGTPVLVAFIVEKRFADGEYPDGSIFGSFSTKFLTALKDMTQKISQDLPVYMVPATYIPIWTMPALVSSKTDRKKLREIGTMIDRQSLRRFNAAMTDHVKPTTEMELAICAIWVDILGGSDEFSANDNFFSMGGDSIRAMKLVSAAGKQNIRLNVANIMMNPTLAGMAKTAQVVSSDETDDIPAFSLLPKGWNVDNAIAEVASACGISKDQVDDIYPCTPLQEGLIALSTKNSGGFVAQRALELPLATATRLRDAFRVAVAESPVLRTRIVSATGRGLVQVVAKGSLTDFEDDNLERYLEQDRQTPMGLGTPLFRFALISGSGKEKAQVVLTMHHAIYDGWSVPLMCERVNQIYKGEKPTPTVDFKQFIRFLLSIDKSESDEYWRKYLDGAHPVQFPPLPEPTYLTKSDSLYEYHVTLPSAAHSQTTMANLIRGAWSLVSQLYLGHHDVVFGETIIGRSASVPGVESIEGPMITTFPVRVHMDMERTVNQHMQDIQATYVKQIPYEHVGLQNISRVSADARHACEIRTGLVINPPEMNPEGLPSLEEEPAGGFVPPDAAAAAEEARKFNTYALMLVFTLEENGFLIMAAWDSNCLSYSALERVLGVFDRVITKCCENPQLRLVDVANLNKEESADAEAIRPVGITLSEPPATVSQTAKQSTGEASGVPITEDEQRLRSVLAPILGLAESDILPSDSFFELGADSISAMRFASDARPHGYEITVAQIFKTRTISALAASIQSSKESKLKETIGRVLDIPAETIDLGKNFNDLGGNSEAASQFIAEARSQGLVIEAAQLSQNVPLSALLSQKETGTSTAAENTDLDAPFAALTGDLQSLTAEDLQPHLQNKEWKIRNAYPTRPLQKYSVDATVNLPRFALRYEVIHFPAFIDQAKLQRSCEELVARNEALRTVFIPYANQTLGVVIDNLHAAFEQISVPEGENIVEFAKKFSNEDIEKPKPHGSSFVGFLLFTSSDNKEAVLVFRISHAQYDEICLPGLYEQLVSLYSGTTVPATVPFTRHVNYCINKSIPESIPYWKELLDGSQISILSPPEPPKSNEAVDIYREFDISTRPSGITIGSLPTAAWAVVLARRLSIRDVVFGEVVTGRAIGTPDADRIFGPTWNYVPFRVPFQDSWTYRDLLEFVQTQHVQSAAHESMGLSEIVEHCTNWDPKKVTWFDTVVHQAPGMTESMSFGNVAATFEITYPHAETLREWKCQAFVQDGGNKLGVEIVAFKEWKDTADALLQEVGEVLASLVSGSTEKVF
ncbi:acetyl-CoA synthetase-like protein [Aaosphaeria arxii CBS 175.79]|uniref:Acetyl-CoA synthetase-like protein n=1 Tax=Aaosphaeria arxii CBS 175.79 TaxID=1450172 RepID=A0A6A5Y7T8_9PLEO|nr:acetyl-CoA synthetase-like protein [Aaosphaeria arxii CBS 175.79]KAF2021067.1 acetyl-CoA synthetase-like protein [Aaosphaeria arxii CBS 175.79]